MKDRRWSSLAEIDNCSASCPQDVSNLEPRVLVKHDEKGEAKRLADLRLLALPSLVMGGEMGLHHNHECLCHQWRTIHTVKRCNTGQRIAWKVSGIRNIDIMMPIPGGSVLKER